MSYVLSQTENGVTVFTINRPQQMNALNREVLSDLEKAIDSLDFAVTRCLIITGSGEKAFVAGADIAQMRDMRASEGLAFGMYGDKVFRMIERLPIPVIAAINGFALGGGCELAMACDIRFASDKARFGQPEVGLGITPGFSGTQRLARLVGKSKAMQLILTGDAIKADEALAIGLVDKVVEPERLMEEVQALAARMLKNAPLAVKYSTIAIKRGLETDIETGALLEAGAFGMCFDTADQKEGMSAFLEKRKAEFKGQ